MQRRAVRKRSSKVGLPPGTLVHVGENSGGVVHVSAIAYDQNAYHTALNVSLEQALTLRDKAKNIWIDVEAIHDVELVRRIGEYFSLHPLMLEDIVNPNQRPKRESYDGLLYIVLKSLNPSNSHAMFNHEQVSIVLGSNFIISFQQKPGDVFAAVRQRFENSSGRLRQREVDYLAYALLDTIVDGYFAVLETMGERIEALESQLVKDPEPQALKVLYALKRNALFLRRCIWPLRDVLSSIEHGEQALFLPGTRVYIRDVYDHTTQVIDTIETYREMLSGMLEVYLSSTSNRLNSVMRVLTVITTIFMPLSFIAGIYGMNFEHMPELQWRYGYPLTLLVMLAVATGMIAIFRIKKWL